MTDILYRAELRDIEQGRQILLRGALPWVGEQLKQGRPLVAEFRLLDDDITDKQRGYLHAVVLTEIALYASPGGVKHDMKTWKEYFRSEFLGFKVVTSINPLTGKKARRRVRISTEDLGVRGLAEYIDRVIAFASTELGLTISEPLPPELRPGRRRPAGKTEHIDAETGEILETT